MMPLRNLSPVARAAATGSALLPIAIMAAAGCSAAPADRGTSDDRLDSECAAGTDCQGSAVCGNARLMFTASESCFDEFGSGDAWLECFQDQLDARAQAESTSSECGWLAVSAFIKAEGVMPVPLDRVGDWGIEGELIGPREEAHFGGGVAVSGDTLVVGAPGTAILNQDDKNGNLVWGETGLVHVYRRHGVDTPWELESVVVPMAEGRESLIDAGDQYGSAVAIDGDRMVVGAPSGDLTKATLNSGVGVAYVFERDGDGVWQLAATLTIDGAQEELDELGTALRWDSTANTWVMPAGALRRRGQNFGAAVAIEGDTIVVGAPIRTYGEPSTPLTVFTRTAVGAWQRSAAVAAPEGAQRFGYAIDLSGDGMVVGAPGTGSSAKVGGSAHVYRHDAATGEWVEEARMAADDPTYVPQWEWRDDDFGLSVAIDGDLVAVGARDDRSLQERDRDGAVYLYRRSETSGQWAKEAYLTDDPAADDNTYDDTDAFGTSVALASGLLIVGAPGDDDYNSYESYPTYPTDGTGAFYVFDQNADSGVWQERAYVRSTDWDPGDGFGSRLAFDGETLILGVPVEDSSEGGVRSGAEFGLDMDTFDSGAVHVYGLGAMGSADADADATSTGGAGPGSAGHHHIDMD